MTNTREFFCKVCFTELTTDNNDIQVQCPYCKTIFTIDYDAEFVEGRWINQTTIYQQDQPQQ